MLQSARRSAAGFTIIEAIVLIGVIATALWAGSRYFQKISRARKQAEIAGRMESFGARVTPELNAAIAEIRVMEGNLRNAVASLEQTLKDLGRDPSRDPDVQARSRTLREVTARRVELEERRRELYLEHAKYRLAPDENLHGAVDRKLAEGRAVARAVETQYLILSRPRAVPALPVEGAFLEREP